MVQSRVGLVTIIITRSTVGIHRTADAAHFGVNAVRDGIRHRSHRKDAGHGSNWLPCRVAGVHGCAAFWMPFLRVQFDAWLAGARPRPSTFGPIVPRPPRGWPMATRHVSRAQLFAGGPPKERRADPSVPAGVVGR